MEGGWRNDLREVNLLRAWSNLREGHGDGDALGRGQYGQVVLLAVAVRRRADADSCDEEGGGLMVEGGGSYVERDGCGRAVGDADLLLLLVDDFLGLGVEQLQHGGAFDGLVAHVHHAGADASLIVLAQEARHVRLNHHVLAGYGFVADLSVHHVLRVGDAHEAPRGEALGQRELQRHGAGGIGDELRHEECRLLQVLAHLHLGLLRLFLILYDSNGASQVRFLLNAISHYGDFIQAVAVLVVGSCLVFCHVVEHFFQIITLGHPHDAAIARVVAVGREYVVVEAAVAQRRHIQRCERLGTVSIDSVP